MDKKLLDKAFRLLSIRDHSSFELTQKLIRKGWSSGEIKKVIDYLLNAGYLNDSEFAKKYIEYKCLTSPRGYYKLRTELKLKGVSDGDIQNALVCNKYSETDLARDLINRKARIINNFSGIKRKEKLFQILKNRGFSLETIYKVTESC